jgi:hypothetical protein
MLLGKLSSIVSKGNFKFYITFLTTKSNIFVESDE